MHPVRPRRFLRRVSVYGTFVALLALVAVSLSQCQMVSVGDSATGLDFNSREGGQCIAQCNQVANDAIRAESDLHVRNVRACAGNSTCLANDEARHEAAVNAIQAARTTCQANCHHQGGGSGGL